MNESLGGLNVEFGQRDHNRDGIECICYPSHGKSVAGACDEVNSLKLCAAVEVLSCLAKPHADNKEGCQACEETKETNPGGSLLD